MEATPFTPQEIEALRKVAKRESLSSLKNRARLIAASISKRDAEIGVLNRRFSIPSVLDFPDSHDFSDLMRSAKNLHSLSDELLEVLREVASIHETNNEETI